MQYYELLSVGNAIAIVSTSAGANNITKTYSLVECNGQLGQSSRGVRPVVNLKKNLKIIGGSGTIEEPYTF